MNPSQVRTTAAPCGAPTQDDLTFETPSGRWQIMWVKRHPDGTSTPVRAPALEPQRLKQLKELAIKTLQQIELHNQNDIKEIGFHGGRVTITSNTGAAPPPIKNNPQVTDIFRQFYELGCQGNSASRTNAHREAGNETVGPSLSPANVSRPEPVAIETTMTVPPGRLFVQVDLSKDNKETETGPEVLSKSYLTQADDKTWRLSRAGYEEIPVPCRIRILSILVDELEGKTVNFAGMRANNGMFRAISELICEGETDRDKKKEKLNLEINRIKNEFKPGSNSDIKTINALYELFHSSPSGGPSEDLMKEYCSFAKKFTELGQLQPLFDSLWEARYGDTHRPWSGCTNTSDAFKRFWETFKPDVLPDSKAQKTDPEIVNKFIETRHKFIETRHKLISVFTEAAVCWADVLEVPAPGIARQVASGVGHVALGTLKAPVKMVTWTLRRLFQGKKTS